MAAPVSVNQFEVKSHETPDELRTPDKSKVEVVHVDSFALGRLSLRPGWRWSECIKPIVKTEQCELSHVGYAVSGNLTVRMRDGTEKAIRAGDSYTIPPGHDAWVDGDETFVGIEVLSADAFAKQV